VSGVVDRQRTARHAIRQGLALDPLEDQIASGVAGFLETVLAADEVITEVRVPKATGVGFGFQKFNRRAQDWAIVGVAAVGGDDPGVALVNMASTPIRATATESALTGAPAHHTAVLPAADRAAESGNPTSDLSASAEYRNHLACVLTKRAVIGCVVGYVDEA